MNLPKTEVILVLIRPEGMNSETRHCCTQYHRRDDDKGLTSVRVEGGTHIYSHPHSKIEHNVQSKLVSITDCKLNVI